MNQFVGFIEIESGGATVADLAAPCDDATLDELFARLVSGIATADETDAAGDTIEVTADLALLSEDLSLTARQLVREIFLTRGGRC